MSDNRNSKQTAPGAPGEKYPDSPGKVAGQLDEASAIQTDVTEHHTEAADSDAHHPAAATSIADEEAGGSSGEGRIIPLKRRP